MAEEQVKETKEVKGAKETKETKGSSEARKWSRILYKIVIISIASLRSFSTLFKSITLPPGTLNMMEFLVCMYRCSNVTWYYSCIY